MTSESVSVGKANAINEALSLQVADLLDVLAMLSAVFASFSGQSDGAAVDLVKAAPGLRVIVDEMSERAAALMDFGDQLVRLVKLKP